MKPRALLALILLTTLSGCGVISSDNRPSVATSSPGSTAGARPNDIYSVLLRSLRMNALAPPATQLQFGRTKEKDVLRIVNDEAPVAPERVATAVSADRRYRYVLAQYRGSYSMVYRFGHEGGKWKRRLYMVGLRVPMRGARRPETSSEAYWRLEEMYGPPSRVEKLAVGSAAPARAGLKGNNLYVWEARRQIITYRSLYDEAKQENITIVEYWDAARCRSNANCVGVEPEVY